MFDLLPCSRKIFGDCQHIRLEKKQLEEKLPLPPAWDEYTRQGAGYRIDSPVEIRLCRLSYCSKIPMENIEVDFLKTVYMC